MATFLKDKIRRNNEEIFNKEKKLVFAKNFEGSDGDNVGAITME